MNTHALNPTVASVHGRTAHGGPWHYIIDHFLLLPIGALIALVWANTFADSYYRLAQAGAYAVNEIGMALFLGLVVQEAYEALMPGGALYAWRRAATPIVAAAGGCAAAAAVYLTYVNLKYELVLSPAWPVAIAVDVAAAYYITRTIWRGRGIAAFVLILTLASDAFGVLFVGVRSQVFRDIPTAAAFMAAALLSAAVMKRYRIADLWFYVAVPGALSWMALYQVGVHPALALLPIVPFMPREPRNAELFTDTDGDTVRHFEHRWNGLVQVVLFLFGLMNAGIAIHEHGTGTWSVLAANALGRPVGIVVAVAVALALGLHLPPRMSRRDVVVVAFAVSSGFAFPLFFATGIMPMGPILGELKLGVLAGAALAAVAFGLARLLRVGRFAGASH
jgi:Na+:H+ antiporter, NhaA family